MKSAKASLSTAKNVILFPLRRASAEDEQAFLPAALEIVETPPSPIGRAVGLTIIALFCLALAWSILGQVDIFASATGKIVPGGRVKLIQPLETGVIRAINVKDGQNVKAGDVLIELDPTMSTADEAHVRNDLIAAELNIARLQAALSDTGTVLFHPPSGARPELIAMQRQLLSDQMGEYRAKLASLDAQRAEKEADRNAVVGTIDKLKASQGLLKQRVDILQQLIASRLASKLNYLEAAQLLSENENELVVQQNRLAESDAAISAVDEAQDREVAAFHRSVLSDLTDAERKAEDLSSDLAKAKQRRRLQFLTAPVDGVVQQLSVHTVGGVVTPAQQLAVIVPSGANLEVEAMIQNKDIGFVHPGQEAQIKVNTFDFTRYGVIHGQVINVSGDAIIQNVTTGQDRDRNNADSENGNQAGQDLNYAALISLDRSRIHVGDSFAKLSPGMAVQVEIKTGSRAIIGYLLSPLLRHVDDSMHER